MIAAPTETEAALRDCMDRLAVIYLEMPLPKWERETIAIARRMIEGVWSRERVNRIEMGGDEHGRTEPDNG